MDAKIKTPVASRLLGKTDFYLLSLIRAGRIAPPEKDSSGHYLWGADDLDAVRQAMRIDRRRKEGGARCDA